MDSIEFMTKKIEELEKENSELKEKIGIAIECIEYYADKDSIAYNTYEAREALAKIKEVE